MEWEAVLWDLGGVILDTGSIQEGRVLFVASLAARYDLDAPEAIETWNRELGEYFRERDGRVFRPAREGYQQTVDHVVGEAVPVAEWLPLAIQAADVAFRPVDGIVETLRTLSEAGYYLALVSDIDTWEAEFILANFGVRDCFDHLTTSEEVGHTKPAQAVFETALGKAPVPPDRALYVGDRYEHDMQGGKRAGLGTVAYGGSAAAAAAGDERDSTVVDFVVDDVRDILTLVDLDDGE